MRSSNRLTPEELREFRYYIVWFLVVGVAIVLILPVILMLVFSIVTPSYMAPMVHDSLGILLLAAAAVVLVAGGAATLLAVRMLRAGRPMLVIVLILVGTFVCAFPALWLVLLGPALVILSHGG